MKAETYSEVRQKAHNGDVIFLHVDKKNILSRITSKFTGSPLTHSAILFWVVIGGIRRLMLIESTTNGGIRIVQASIYEDRPMYYVSASTRWKTVQERAFESLGKVKYGWFSAIYIGIRDFMFTHFEIKLPSKMTRNPACSEFTAYVLGLEETDIPPSRLYQVLTQKSKQP